MYGFKLACSCLLVFTILGFNGAGRARGADEYVAPPEAEREAVAALKAKGAILQVDGNYRVFSVVLLTNCSNEEVKLLAACERLTNLQIQSTRITDESIEHFQALPKLTSILISSSGLTAAGIASLKSASPMLRVSNLPARTSAPATGRTMATRGAPAGEVASRFINSGVTAKVGGYMPLRAEMNGSADMVKKAPDGLQAAKYGSLKLGAKTWLFILDEPDGKSAKLYVDTNADGDLTNDAATTWTVRTTNGFMQYSGTGKVDLGGGSIGSVNMYRFDPNDSQRAALKNTLMFYPDYGYEITLTLDGMSFTTAVPGEPGTMPVWIDRDGNKVRSSKREMIRLGSPFNFTGTTYVLNRDGNVFKLETPNVSLPLAPLPPNLAVGQKALPFELTTLDGKKIDFPKTYSGKLVMLDFWATWCGPCVAELPNVKQAYADWHDKGFEVLGISFDNANMDEKVKTFLHEHDLPWPQIYEGKGWTTTLGEQYDVTAIPFVLLVDGDSGEILAITADLRGPKLSEFIGKQLANKKG